MHRQRPTQRTAANTPAKLDPRVSEFDTQEEADRYDRWLRAKVRAALDGREPGLPHDEAMARVDRLLAKMRKKRADH